MDALEILRNYGLLDPSVLAIGFERGWVDRGGIVDFAIEQIASGNESRVVVELSTCEDLDADSIMQLLARWAGSDLRQTSVREQALRRWQLGFLKALSLSPLGPEEQLDRLEELYAMLGYPEEMRECSRYYVPPEDRARGLKVGDITESPLGAMARLVATLEKELGGRSGLSWTRCS